MKKLLFSILLTISALAHGTACQTFAAGDLNYITKLNLLANGCNAVTPAAGVFTTISASGQITSTLATGTAPFVIASTTQVLNLNASQLVGATWASPAAIGTGTPAAGTFSSLKDTGLTTGLVLGAAASNFSTYAGSSCTNQFVRSLNASGAATCATVGSSDLASSLALTTPNIGAATATTIVGTDTTDATSSTAAAVKTAGGLAVAKKLYVGTDINVGGSVGIGGNTTSARATSAGTIDNSATTLGSDDVGTLAVANTSAAATGIKAKLNFKIAGVGGSTIAGYYGVFNGSGDIGTGLIFGTQTNLAGGVVERVRIDQSGNVGIGKTPATVLDVNGGIATPITTQTGATYTVLTTDSSLIANRAGTITYTLPTASSYTGRWLYLRTITANTVVSATSNVVPAAGGSAGTAILAATAGKWAALQSDGTNWQIMMSN